jgi:[NiFe] hydrogenase diaphorase moiety small subunit
MNAPAPQAAVFYLDGQPIPFAPGQSIMQAALAAGVFIPHLCYHPEFRPHGSCKLCTVKVDGRAATSCTLPAAADMQVECNTPKINERRRALLQMLLVEGNHFCPSCEQSGNCKLQSLGYELGVLTPHFNQFYPDRPVDASHPDVLLDFNRCILCELCIRASAEVDGKHVFALSGRGIGKHLIVNAESGRLADTHCAPTDKAAHVCPVGVILHKRKGFAVPIGQRHYDAAPISAHVDEFKPAPLAGAKRS